MSDWRDFLENLIYKGLGNQRFTQDSPVLPDVWIHFGLRPNEPLDLLLTPTFDVTPARLAQELTERLDTDRASDYHQKFLATLKEKGHDKALMERKVWPDKPMVAYNQSTVAARLWFHQLVRAALPLSTWWHHVVSTRKGVDPVGQFADAGRREDLAAELVGGLEEPRAYDTKHGSFTLGTLWMARVVGAVSMVTDLGSRNVLQEEVVELLDEGKPANQRATRFETLEDWQRHEPAVVRVLEDWNDDAARVVQTVFEVLDGMEGADLKRPPVLWSVNRNRPTEAAIYHSTETVKADAAARVFEVTGSGIRWAILDSGIDATHFAFRKRKAKGPEAGKPIEPAFEEKDPVPRRGDKWKNNTRVIATYDFTRIRDLLSGDPEVLATLPESTRERIADQDLVDNLRRSLQTGRMVDWEMLEPVLRVPHDGTYAPRDGTEAGAIPQAEHGTHVAGILAADWRAGDDVEDSLADAPGPGEKPNFRRGVCPEIELYDLRVIDDEGGDEFSTMAALQFIRSLNARKDYTEIHGVNLSLSIHHDVSNYACGRTPVCEECERLAGAGIVVVAAAGNKGRARYMTENGRLEEGYRNTSITDPGNTAAAITVGATHRQQPHSYGVSYFSSRGPTGDGRIKPDLVAPGEKILSTFPEGKEDYLDGTSMAAPHVSGAAALLMERYSELIGHPDRIKEILCDTATDLGRERYFQGAGLLDILRALQSV